MTAYFNISVSFLDFFNDTNACDKEVSSKLCGDETNCTSDENNDFQCQCKDGFKVIGSYKPLLSENTYVEKCKGKPYFCCFEVNYHLGQ